MARKKPLPTPAPEPATQLAGLVQACKDEPDDDGLRLILADWLDDHDDPARAELIRLSLPLSRSDIQPASLASLHARMAQLRRDNDARWLGTYPTYERETEFHRGLISITTRMQQFRSERGLAELMALAPWTERLWLHLGQQPQAGEFVESPAASAFTALHIVGTQLDRTLTARVASAPCAPHLRELSLSLRERPVNPALPLFASSSALTGLRSLTLHGRLKPTEVAALPAASFAPTLRSLTLRYWEKEPWSLAPLVESDRLAGLTALRVNESLLGPENLRRLAGSSHLRKLSTLNLENTGAEDAGVIALAASPILDSVRVLVLAYNNLGDAAAEALARSPHVANLEELNLRENVIGDAGLRALAESPHLGRLRTLNLSRNRITTTGARALAGSRTLAELTRLDLGNNFDLGTEGCAALFSSERLSRLADLSLSSTGVDDHAIEVLVRGPLASRLRRLRVDMNQLWPRSVELLAESASLGQLEALELAATPLDASALRALARSSTLARLVWLEVPLRPETEAGVSALASGDGLPSLVYLSLEGAHGLSKPTKEALVQSPRRAGLFFLNFSNVGGAWEELWPLRVGFPTSRD
jgi:uncharacterized protein (TIGR02996 family)